MLDDIIAAREHLSAASGIADTLGARWEAFELARSASRPSAQGGHPSGRGARNHLQTAITRPSQRNRRPNAIGTK